MPGDRAAAGIAAATQPAAHWPGVANIDYRRHCASVYDVCEVAAVSDGSGIVVPFTMKRIGIECQA